MPLIASNELFFSVPELEVSHRRTVFSYGIPVSLFITVDNHLPSIPMLFPDCYSQEDLSPPSGRSGWCDVTATAVALRACPAWRYELLHVKEKQQRTAEPHAALQYRSTGQLCMH